jgi:hypothetical protein
MRHLLGYDTHPGCRSKAVAVVERFVTNFQREELRNEEDGTFVDLRYGHVCPTGVAGARRLLLVMASRLHPVWVL